MAEAIFVQCEDALDYTPAAAVAAGKVVLLPSQQAGVIPVTLAAGELGAAIVEGVFDIAAATGTTFDDGAPVYWDDTNKLAVAAGAATASWRLGRAIGAKASGPTVVRVELNAPIGHTMRSVAVADSSAVTNTTTETVVGTFTIPAASLKVGNVIRFIAGIVASATNSTDTFRCRVRLGGASGTVVADTTAIDLANGDQGVMAGEITVRAVGASGSVAAASLSVLKTTATPIAIAGTTVDTTAAITLVATITESVANAGNSAVSTVFNAELR